MASLRDVYPFDVPSDAHPMAFLLLGFGLDVQMINALCRHLFDDLGVKFAPVEPRDVVVRLAVGQSIVPDGYTPVELGAKAHVPVAGGERSCGRLVAGHVPPGTRFNRMTATIEGVYQTPGLYEATIRVGTAKKYDPLGGTGAPDSPGRWIAWEDELYKPEPVEVPTTTDNLSAEELEEVITAMREAQAAKLAAVRQGRD